jgi:hypothetical protein
MIFKLMLNLFNFISCLMIVNIFIKVDIGSPIWLHPLPRLSSSNTFDPFKKCPDWSALSIDEFNYHRLNGKMNSTNLNAVLQDPLLIDRIFHIRTRNGNLHIMSHPINCEKTPVCWRRAQFFIQQLDDIVGGATASLDVPLDVDILYWPWDEPFMKSFEWPIWQYNRKVDSKEQRKKGGMSMLIPYSYAFSYKQLKDLRLEDGIARKNKYNLRQQSQHKLEEDKSDEIDERKNSIMDKAIFRGSMTYPLDVGWKRSARGQFCINIDNNPDIAKYIDFGIVTGRSVFRQYKWKNPNIGCGRQIKRVSLLEQETKYNYILDIEGQSGFTDRLPNLLSLKSTTIIREERYNFEDFLSHYIKPFKHYVPLKRISNIISTVKYAQSNPNEMINISNEASRLVDERLTDHSCLCAIYSNLLSIQKIQLMNSNRVDDGISNNVHQINQINQMNGIKITSLGRAIIWERWQNGPYVINVQTRDFVLSLKNVIIFFVVSILLLLFARCRQSHGKEKGG